MTSEIDLSARGLVLTPTHRDIEPHPSPTRTDDDVRIISLWLILFAFIMIGIMLALAYNGENSAAGWVAVIGASIIFGTTGNKGVLKSLLSGM